MAALPRIPGFEILSEIGRDTLASSFRLQGPDSPCLVLFHDPALASAVQAEARRLGSVALDEVEGLVRLERVIQHEGRPGVILRGDLGSDLWRSPVLGELRSLPLLHQLADVLAGLFRRDLSHGALLPGGACLRLDGTVVVLPPVILPGFLKSAAPPLLSPAGQDLSALAHLACHLIGGLRPNAAAGVGSLPEELKNVASPAAAAAVRILLEAAARNPSPADALEVLERIGWAQREDGTSRRARVPVVVQPSSRPSRAPESPAPRAAEGAGSPGTERRVRPRRIPALVGVLLLALLGAGLLMIGAGDALSEFWSGRPRVQETLPTPESPLDRSSARAGTDEASDAAFDSGDPADLRAGGSLSTEDSESASTALADEILARLAERQAQKPTVSRKKRGTDRTLIREGDHLLEQAKTTLADLREGTPTPQEKNARLEQAIGILEQSREKYEAFAEQFPTQERLVENKLSDVNALIFHAYRQKTVK